MQSACARCAGSDRCAAIPRVRCSPCCRPRPRVTSVTPVVNSCTIWCEPGQRTSWPSRKYGPLPPRTCASAVATAASAASGSPPRPSARDLQRARHGGEFLGGEPRGLRFTLLRIVLAQEQHRQRIERGDVERLIGDAFVERAVAEHRDRDVGVFLCLSAKPPPTESPIEPPTIAEVDWKPSDASVMCQVPPLPPHSPSTRPRISAKLCRDRRRARSCGRGCDAWCRSGRRR